MWILRSPEGLTLFKNRRLIVRMLSLVLLLAQLGMQAHAYSHLTPGNDSAPGTSTAYCSECVSLAPLLGLGGSAPAVCLAHQTYTDDISLPDLVPVIERLPTAAFRSRAPPRIL